MKGTVMPWPTDITAMDKGRVLEVAFDDGQVIRLAAERLRVESPSAEVQGHDLLLVFDDLHDTGIYSWEYLHELGREQDRRWQAYLAALEARGLSREP